MLMGAGACRRTLENLFIECKLDRFGRTFCERVFDRVNSVT